MFDNTDTAAFIVNVILLVFCISSYPFNQFYVISGSLKLYKDLIKRPDLSDQELLGRWYNLYTIGTNAIPFAITMFVPYIAAVLGMAGSVLGLFVLYLVPVLTYLAKLKKELNTISDKDCGDDDY